MDLILEKAMIIAPDQPLHGKRKNILIRDGKIHAISDKSFSEGNKIKSKDLHVSIGWFDLGCHIGEPGYEHREDIKSISASAAKGGYTGLAMMPNTKPCLQSKSEIEFVLQKSKNLPIQIFPLGAISKKCEGTELSEMIDMANSGAIAFTDGLHPVQDSGLILRAMLYSKHFDGLIMNHPDDASLSGGGLMHEGSMALSLGMKGIPSIAELMMLRRDIELATYAGSKYLAHLISTTNSVDTVKLAKKKNKKIFASVSYLNLLFQDLSLKNFDTHYKQSPPLREANDVKSLINGIKEGTIDIISSNHRPLEIEKKELEFAYAEEGTTGLETCFAALFSAGILDAQTWVNLAAINPRKILNLEIPRIEINQSANLTLFDPSFQWVYKDAESKSKSKNTMWSGHHFTAKVIGTICGSIFTENNSK